MDSIDYIKEKLNTLRIEFMAQILIIIALGSGLSKMYLNGAIFGLSNYLYNFGIVMFCTIMINLIITIFKLNKNLKDLK